MASATIDTNIMIWGIKSEASPGQEDRIERAKLLLEQLDERRIRLVLTAHVVAEYLCGFPVELRDDQFRILSEHFPIISFDLKAAGIAAELLHDKENIKSLQSDYRVSRQVIKADIAIVASAVAANVNYIYSDDGKVRKLASGLIIPEGLPELNIGTVDQSEGRKSQGDLLSGLDE